MIYIIKYSISRSVLSGLIDISKKKHSVKIKYFVGTMIELPRAAIRAKDIAKYADFFSFGTND